MDELHQLRVESIMELSEDITEVIVDMANKHGNDPELGPIIGAALTMTIRDINKIAPGFIVFMVSMLEDELEDE